MAGQVVLTILIIPVIQITVMEAMEGLLIFASPQLQISALLMEELVVLTTLIIPVIRTTVMEAMGGKQKNVTTIFRAFLMEAKEVWAILIIPVIRTTVMEAMAALRVDCVKSFAK
jgi:ABC-type phosphate transport system permease subunit